MPKGKAELTLTPEAFLDLVAQLISRPRKHRPRYQGALAPNSPMRRKIVQYANQPLPEKLGKIETLKKRVKETKACVKVVSLWAILIARIYVVMPLTCLTCGSEMKIIAFIKEPTVINKILDHIGEPTELPTFRPARGL